MSVIYYGAVIGYETLAALLGISSLAALGLWLGFTKPTSENQTKALTKARTLA